MTGPDTPAPLPELLPDTEPEPAEGRAVPCEECDEPLHDRVSRLYRLGPRCRVKRGIRVGPGIGRFDVEQDGLPGL